MANFEPKKLDLEDINGGIRFTESDGVTPNAINDPIEAVAYSQTVVEHLTDTPDTSEINGAGNPNVSFVSSTTADGVTIHKFKFSNLSGATFTPSLDEAGNLSWSNNRNLPNPPTINISGRDYLFSSEVLSGTSIPQVNSEVTDMPLTSFNRAPVDDIDHCYLFYYYTPENIYYWLATQVVDIQETTATLKILSVVRLTGYTPTIGENGNWFIGGEDTGKLSYGASGVTDVVAGASYNQDDFTITPLTFNFEVGNSKTVNVKAAIGNVEDGSYAKLAQVVRKDAYTDPLTTAEAQKFMFNSKYMFYGKFIDTSGWYRIGKLIDNGRYVFFVTHNYQSTFTYNIKIEVAISRDSQVAIQLFTPNNNPSGGVTKVRVSRISDTNYYVDVYVAQSARNQWSVSLDMDLSYAESPDPITTDKDVVLYDFETPPSDESVVDTITVNVHTGTTVTKPIYVGDSQVALQDGTYDDMTVGKANNSENVKTSINGKAITSIFETDGTTVKKATQDANGNVINATYAKLSQVVRVDAAQSLTDEEKTRAKDNLVIQTTKNYSRSATKGWYRVAKLKIQSAYSVTIGQTYNYISPINIKLALNLGYQNAVITQESGIIPSTLSIDRVRVCIGTTTDAFFDVHTSAENFNTTRISIDRLYNIDNAVAIETYDDWEYLGTDDTVTGYNVTQLDMVSGTNTSGQVYQQGSPVLVGFDSPKLSVTSGAGKLPGRGWYCINYKATSFVLWYSTGVFYWGGDATCLPVSAYSLSTVSIIKRAVNISSNGTVTVFDPDSGTRYTDFTVEIYKLA